MFFQNVFDCFATKILGNSVRSRAAQPLIASICSSNLPQIHNNLEVMLTDSANAKVRIKVGGIEIEYEGGHEFLTNGLHELIENVGLLASSSDLEEEISGDGDGSDEAPSVDFSNGQLELSANSIAHHYSAKSTSDLALCAIILLQIVNKQVSCSREEVLKAMQSATDFYNKNMRGTNLKSALKTLKNKKKINELANEKYALTSTEKQSAEAALASIG